ncbi:putative ribonuclease VapC37 [Mycobacterium xenopi 4042]|uniref:Putative ribonuclease VapC37 n=1 Tax=Mycobacterium xenopi 4042 TaxID=1299334 RepID=X8AFJ5_MYCXE|nr:putative ribonuclease VapC37 [Mycobacterium xenopi 4042]
MIVDANLLLFAVDENSSHNAAAAAWLEQTLNGDTRVGLPWQTIGAFLRIVTHPRVTENPLSGTDAWRYVEQWLAVPVVWVPPQRRTPPAFTQGCARRWRSPEIWYPTRNWPRWRSNMESKSPLRIQISCDFQVCAGPIR